MRIDVPDRSADVFFYGLFMAMSYNLPQPPAASERNPEQTAGHDETACRTSQFTSVAGSHGSRCARSASRIRLHCDASRSRTGRSRTRPAGTRRGPTGIGHPGCKELERHRFMTARRFRSAALSQEGDVDDLAGADLLGLTRDNH